MKVEQLKLYNKYKDIDKPDKEFIFIGIVNEDYYCFLYKYENYNSLFSRLRRYILDPDKIVKDLNLETGVYSDGNKYIKGYDWICYSKENIEIFLKPLLKDKINNILNR